MSNKSPTDLIAVPTGGGGVRGIGESFSPDLFTGTGNYSVPIDLPAGRNGLQPSLTLSYSTGNAGSVFGLGWRLPIPEIARRTSHGVPRYDDAEDTFVLSGGEPLVPVASGSQRTRYRPRVESSFARIVHVHDAVGSDYWVVRGRDGHVSRYGTPRPVGAPADWLDPAVVADPDDPTRRFAWKLTETRDPFGNRVEYFWQRDAQRQDGPHHWDHLYLSAVRYVDYGPASAPHFGVLVGLRYGPRPDPFSSYRAGFEIRTVQRCRAIEVRTRTDRVRRCRTYQLTYLDEESVPADQLPINGASLLSRIAVEGHDDEAGVSQAGPSLHFDYGRFRPEGRRFEPLAGDELPPASLANDHYESVDLFGDGLPDIVEIRDGAARYWRNLGGGRLDRPRSMPNVPAGVDLADPHVWLLDADGDGRAELVDLRAGRAGYYALDASGHWDAGERRPWDRPPALPLGDPELHWIDLTGNGTSDALRSHQSFECYFNDPVDGWGETRRVARRQLADFPDVSLSSPRVKLADMTGDGLTDVVLLHDRRVDYWPALGHGDFGRRVTMANAPELPLDYDPGRVLLGDVDGDGLADLVYVNARAVTVWINRAGNGWSRPVTIPGTPGVTDPDAVRLVDLLGSGVAGVLWSRNASSLPRDHLYFLDLTGGHKPYLLEAIDNGMGAITRIAYGPSTRHALRDLGTPLQWRSTLPFPVQVVDRVEAIDAVSGGRLTSEYRYHHGYWDGAERELRGFGRVDRRDSETRSNYQLATSGPDPPAFDLVEPAHFSAPLEVRTWFHLGPVGPPVGAWGECDFDDEYWSGDRPYLQRPPDVDAALQALARPDRRQALRALKGQALRSESYSLDETAGAARPLVVSEHLHGLRVEHPPGADRPGVYFPYLTATRTSQWERGVDPMTRFDWRGDYDVYGQARESLELAVPRGRDYRAAAGPNVDAFLAKHTVTTYAQRDDAQRYIVDRVAQQSSFEIVDDGRSDTAQPRPSVVDLWAGVSAGSAASELIGQVLRHYDGNDFVGLPLGQLGDHGALKRAEQLVLTPQRLAQGYGTAAGTGSPPPYLDPTGATWTSEYPSGFRSRLPALAGYVHHAGDRVRATGYFAVVTQRALNARGQVVVERDPLGGDTTITYGDGYDWLPTEVADAAGLTTSAEHDYRVQRPSLLTDPNGSRTEYAYTPLGLVASIARLGRAGASEGDTSATPSTRFEYDFSAFPRSGQPASRHSIRRVHRASDSGVPAPERDRTVESRSYFDGFGRPVQRRTLAEDRVFGDSRTGGGLLPAQGAPPSTITGRARGRSDPPNVVVSGWQVYDNKGRPVRQHEAFFGTGWDYTPVPAGGRGLYTSLFYDAQGRATLTVGPDGAEHRTVYGIPHDVADPDRFEPTPWETYTYDANDNGGRVLASHPAASSFARHWDTPTSARVDALGRQIEVIERNGPDPTTDWSTTHAQYDLDGNVVKTWDELGRLTFEYVLDLRGARLRVDQLDTGTQRSVFDAAGNLVEQRDARGAVVLHGRDALGRTTHLWARDDTGGGVTLRERILYGDEAASGLSRAEAEAGHLRGRVYEHYDGAGRVRSLAYDLAGNAVDVERQVIDDAVLLQTFTAAAASGWDVPSFRVDWKPPGATSLAAHADSLLDTISAYRVTQRFDALDRLREVELPDDVDGERKRLRYDYNRAGALRRLRIGDQIVVDHVAYNARGQRTLVVYGDSAAGGAGPRLMTRYAYESTTGRLLRLRTERYTSPQPGVYTSAGDLYQDVSHAYDLVGNLLSVHDGAPAASAPASTYTYDARYRLIAATGREADRPFGQPWDAGPLPADPTQTRDYLRRYTYDAAGNLLTLAHRLRGGVAAVPTRRFELDPGTNRLHEVDAGRRTDRYVYDAAGHLVSENGDRHFGWDHLGRLACFAVQTPGAEPSRYAHYLYDGAGQRVKKLVRTSGGQIRSSVTIGGLFEHHRQTLRGSTHEHNTVHVLDGGSRIATLRVGSDPGDRTPALKLHLSDVLASSVLLVDQQGRPVAREAYYPYGGTSFGGHEKKRYRYTGKLRDRESGLYYHGARYYAPWLARWISPDPAGPADGPNLYVYARNRPTVLVDRTGAESEQSPYFIPKEVDTIGKAETWLNERGYTWEGQLQMRVETDEHGVSHRMFFAGPPATGGGDAPDQTLERFLEDYKARRDRAATMVFAIWGGMAGAVALGVGLALAAPLVAAGAAAAKSGVLSAAMSIGASARTALVAGYLALASPRGQQLMSLGAELLDPNPAAQYASPASVKRLFSSLQRTYNSLLGDIAEGVAPGLVEGMGFRVLGRQVTARIRNFPKRIIDVLAEGADDLMNFEVKHGDTAYKYGQQVKDQALATQGGELVGANAPKALQGMSVTIQTTVIRVWTGLSSRLWWRD